MAKKINSEFYRLGIKNIWDSCWTTKNKNYGKILKQNLKYKIFLNFFFNFHRNSTKFFIKLVYKKNFKNISLYLYYIEIDAIRAKIKNNQFYRIYYIKGNILNLKSKKQKSISTNKSKNFNLNKNIYLVNFINYFKYFLLKNKFNKEIINLKNIYLNKILFVKLKRKKSILKNKKVLRNNKKTLQFFKRYINESSFYNWFIIKNLKKIFILNFKFIDISLFIQNQCVFLSNKLNLNMNIHERKLGFLNQISNKKYMFLNTGYFFLGFFLNNPTIILKIFYFYFKNFSLKKIIKILYRLRNSIKSRFNRVIKGFKILFKGTLSLSRFRRKFIIESCSIPFGNLKRSVIYNNLEIKTFLGIVNIKIWLNKYKNEKIK